MKAGIMLPIIIKPFTNVFNIDIILILCQGGNQLMPI